jgi:hypothetical protein
MQRLAMLALGLFGLLFFSGCVTGQPLTPADIATHGTAAFNASAAKVFLATQNALKTEGYTVAVADAGKGRITTGRKLVRAQAVRTSSYTAQAVEITRQYIIEIQSNGSGSTVTATPRVFQGDLDLSDRSIWDLDGQMGEYVLWTQLFRDIKEAL